METPLPIEFHLQGVPVSSQGSPEGKAAWKNRIEQAVKAVLQEGHWLISRPLSLEILLLLDDDIQGDLDNMIKPIQDAMNRVVYEDDHQFQDVRIAKYLPNRIMQLTSVSTTLASALAQDRPSVYIKIDEGQ